MTPPDWVEEAAELYPKLGSYAAVARRVGVSPSAVRYQLDPEAKATSDESRRRWRKTEAGRESMTKMNARRRDAKREHAQSKRASCVRCGEPRGIGTAWPSKSGDRGLCRKCSDEIKTEAARAKRAKIEELWNAKPMLTGSQIAEAVGITEGALRQQINTMRKQGGWNVPHRHRYPTKGERDGEDQAPAEAGD